LFARVLERHQFARGAGLGSVVFQGGMVIGPALGGALVAWGGKSLSYGLAVVFGTRRIGLPGHAAGVRAGACRAERAPIFKSIAEGRPLRAGQPDHGRGDGAGHVLGAAGRCGGDAAGVHATRSCTTGRRGLGILRGGAGTGALSASGLWLSRRPLQRHAGRVLLFAVAGFGLCVIGFGLSHSFWLSAVILLFAYGAFDGVSVVIRSTILQLATPEEMRGRVSSINGIFISSSNELGAFESGLAAKVLGLVPSVIFGGFA
jgi:hypothetical protein